MDISDGRKRCGRCKEVKPLSEFHRDATGKHGVRSVCKTCAKAVAAAYRQANRAEIAAYSALYHQANRAEIAARKAAYRRANPEKVTAQQAAYHRTHPHVCWEREYRSRCRTYGLTPVIEPFTRDDVVSRYGETCVLCGTAPFEELDHHIPIGAGGPHTLANVRPTCKSCNLRKSRTTDRADIKTVALFRHVAGFLRSRSVTMMKGSFHLGLKNG